MFDHLAWLTSPVRGTNPELRCEIAFGNPETGPNRARTFPIDELHHAAGFAAWINEKGCNVYLGVTLKGAGTPVKGRTGREHAAIAPALAIDFDNDFAEGLRKLGMLARPQVVSITGRNPTRGHAWIRLEPTENLLLWSELNARSVALCGGDRNALGTARLMRLPGSVSYPSPKKRALGYRVELTSAHTYNGSFL